MKLRTAFLSVLLTANGLLGQSTQPEQILQVQPIISVDKVHPGDAFDFALQVTFSEQWHANSHTPSEDYLVPSVLTLNKTNDFQFSDIQYPPGQDKKFSFSDKPISVYHGKIFIRAHVKASKSLKPGQTSIAGTFSYQACNDLTCRIPTSVDFQLPVDVVAAGAQTQLIHQDIFQQTNESLAQLQGDRTDSQNSIGDMMAGSGWFLTLLLIFVGGLALNLTPCVYPIIPITISFFVGQSSGKIGKSFFLALIYVLGMSLTYSILGVIAAMTGGLLGASLQNPIVLIIIAGVFLIFASSMFGAFEIRVPAFLNQLAGGSKQGAFGSFFMGLTVGIVAAPCIGPFVLSLLTYVAAKGDPFTGFLLFFILSMGLGLPYLILGTFSGSLKTLPHSGQWMNWVKRVFGIIMIAVAIYFVNSLIPHVLYVSLLSAVVILGGIWVGFIDKTTANFASFKGIKLFIGMLFLIYGTWFSISSWQEAHAPTMDWQPYSDALISQARSENKPVLIDFFADWCIPCKQIEKKLFSTDLVVAKAKSFIALKADLTKEKSDYVKNLRKKYNVLGVPTVILIDKSGHEFKRFTDELVKFSPEKFVSVMQNASTQGTN